MEPLSLQFITTACAGKLLSLSPSDGERAGVRGGLPSTLNSQLSTFSAHRVCTDSRQLQPGDLFVALAGERFDGHDFLPEVARKAAVLMAERQRLLFDSGRWWVRCANGTQRELDLGNCALIGVDQTRQALGRLAERYRAEFDLPVVAVGGSNGKTTTKELIASVLKQKLATLWSEASFNNDIGVPMSLLKLERSHQAAVFEVGTNHPGELEPLVRMVRPRYGVITSIGREHLEYFGDVAGVAQEEGWVGELLPPQGKLIVNGDSEWTEALARRTRAAVVRVGFAEGNQWRVRSLRLDKQGVTFRVEAPQAEFAGEYRVNLLGRHQAGNALFAIVLGAELGLSRGQIERGLAECKPAKMRLQLWESNGVRVLDDAYNANADSMIAALQTLQGLPCKGRRVAVLGDMAELGAHAEAAHEEVGRQAAQLGVGQLFTVGKRAAVLARGARSAGLTRIFEFGDVEPAAAAVKKFVKNGDLVLLKASRATRLERVAELLRCS